MLLQDALDQDCKEKKPGLCILLMEGVVDGGGRGWSWQTVQGGCSMGKLRARAGGRKKGRRMGMHLGTGVRSGPKNEMVSRAPLHGREASTLCCGRRSRILIVEKAEALRS